MSTFPVLLHALLYTVKEDILQVYLPNKVGVKFKNLFSFLHHPKYFGQGRLLIPQLALYVARMTVLKLTTWNMN